VQQALYSLPQSDYNTITSGSNGYSAAAGYNLVTGLGTPLASLLVPDLVAYQGPGTVYNGPTVGPLQSVNLSGNWTGGGGSIDVFSVLDSLTVGGNGSEMGSTHSSGTSASLGSAGSGQQVAILANGPFGAPSFSKIGPLSVVSGPLLVVSGQ